MDSIYTTSIQFFTLLGTVISVLGIYIKSKSENKKELLGYKTDIKEINEKLTGVLDYIDIEGMNKNYQGELEHIADEEIEFINTLKLCPEFREKCEIWLTYKANGTIEAITSIASKNVKELSNGYLSNLMFSRKNEIEQFAIQTMGEDFYTKKIRNEVTEIVKRTAKRVQSVITDTYTNSKNIRIRELGRKHLRDVLRHAMTSIIIYNKECNEKK